jgi:glucose/mannose transport system substrate-binding protein
MKLRSLVFGSALLLGALGCSSDDKASGDAGAAGKTGTEETKVLNLFSWWVAPGEAEALEALEKLYKKEFVGARVKQEDNPTAGTWQQVLGEKIDDSPWDAFQLSASDLDNFRAEHPGAVAELDDIYDAAGLADVMIPEIRDVVTRKGHAYGVVTGVHRNNSFIYNQRLFDKYKLVPPTSIDELLEVCAALKEAGVTPVATDMDTWVLRILFDELLAGTMGAEGFRDFINGDAPASDAAVQADIEAAIGTFDTLLTEYVDVERSSAADYEWSSAAHDLQQDMAAMLFHGDWAKGYLMHLGFTPDLDFGVSGPPGANDLFVYGADMFGLPTTAPHPELGKDFLSIVASPQGQIEFNKYKGATPMRMDVRDQLEDETAKAGLDNLINAKALMPGHANAGWDAGIEAFAKDHDREALLQVYIDTPP